MSTRPSRSPTRSPSTRSTAKAPRRSRRPLRAARSQFSRRAGRSPRDVIRFSPGRCEPIEDAVDHFDLPWRPLGTLLVGEGLLSAADLEGALSEQRRTGRLLGQILVARGSVSGLELARALARQHGVEIRPSAEVEPDADADPEPAESLEAVEPAMDHDRSWRPLGKLLVDDGFVTAIALRQALAEQDRRPDRRLGEILVDRGHLSGQALAFALAEQHGVDLDAEEALVADLEAVVAPPAPGQPTYQVCDVVY